MGKPTSTWPSEPVSVALQLFGAQLSALRGSRGLTQAELAARVSYSEATVASIEQGRRVPQPEFIERVDDVLDAGGALKASAPFVADARLPLNFPDFADMEAEAVCLSNYENRLVPGLLQTEDYARALISGHIPPLDDETIDLRVSFRMKRQERLARKASTIISYVIEEAVLRRPVGGTAVMKAQLLRLLTEARRRNTTLQVMPTSTWAHGGMSGPIALLETSQRRTIAYTESQGVTRVMTDRDEAAVLSHKYGLIRAQALSVEKSARLIEGLVGEM
ncbi:helix-turn-helix domain-containing protein [Streptomyces sp. URMC 123]|uniref:helix-turn-helix domain-containing protein n=1 Tax=Streptomyces sp. URMC 123 TaxID=3423403 RepID=UPI003F1A97AF